MKESVKVELPLEVVEIAEREVAASDGLFSDISDYLKHCSAFWRRKGL